MTHWCAMKMMRVPSFEHGCWRDRKSRSNTVDGTEKKLLNRPLSFCEWNCVMFLGLVWGQVEELVSCLLPGDGQSAGQLASHHLHTDIHTDLRRQPLCSAVFSCRLVALSPEYTQQKNPIIYCWIQSLVLETTPILFIWVKNLNIFLNCHLKARLKYTHM